MGTTPTYSWPYPEATDPVANGAQDIEDLALAVESTVSGIGGKILQVVSTTKTDTFTASLSAGADIAITGLSATITPSSTSSTILIFATVHGAETSSNFKSYAIRLYRGATEIGSGATAGNRSTVFSANIGGGTGYVHHIAPTGNNYVDSPATTSATTYAVHLQNPRGGTISYRINGSASDTDAVNNARPSSTITVMEVSA